MAEVKVKLEDVDQDLPLARKLRVSTRATTVTTPRRAFHLKQDTSSESRLIQNDKVRGINEIYHVLTKEKIEEIDNDVDKLNEFGKKLRYIFSAPKIKDELNLLFFSYENKTPKVKGAKNVLPSDDEIDYLCNIVTHPQSEIIIPPFIPGLTGYEYLQFLKKFFTYYKSYSKKTHTIMGYIPMVATSELREINQFYFEKGINLFTVDFSGKYPMDSYILVNEIRKLTKVIKKEYRKESYLHAFNVPFARTQPTTYISPAKDILTLIIGFDSFGTYHKKDSKPPEVIKSNRYNGVVLISTVSIAKTGTNSLRTTIPSGIVEYLNIHAGDIIGWEMKLKEGKKYVSIRKNKSVKTKKRRVMELGRRVA